MKSVVNKTNGFLKVPLPQGKVLRLGPRQTGQISVHAGDHPPLLKLKEAGKIEVHDGVGNEAIPGLTQQGKPPFDQ